MSVPKLISRSILFFPVLLLTGILSAGAEAQPPTPLFLEGGKVISAAMAKKFLDTREAEFFDTRSLADSREVRIPGARTLPYNENSERAADFNPSTDQFDLAQLPPNKGKTVVFYCDGPAGWQSYKAAVLAIQTGYRDVMWLREGISGWQSAQHPVE